MKCTNCGYEFSGNRCPFCGSVPITEEKQEKMPEQKQKVIEKPDIFKMIADTASPTEQLRYAYFYLNGTVVAKDDQKATDLFKKAADKGNAEAAFCYAESLENGRGCDANKEKAEQYYRYAAEKGHLGAKIKVKELKSSNASVSYADNAAAISKFEILEKVANAVNPLCVEVTNRAGDGSGFFINERYILTNAHVILDDDKPCDKNIVKIFPEEKSYRASIVKYDAEKDLAILRLDDVPPDRNVDIKLSIDYDYKIARQVFTFGNGLGRGLAFTEGYIGKNTESNYGYDEIIPLNMSVNGGNSGGAVFDLAGNIIGIMSSVPSLYSGMGAYGISYAITCKVICDFIKSVKI